MEFVLFLQVPQDTEDRFGNCERKSTYFLTFDNTPPIFIEIGTSPRQPTPGAVISIYVNITDASPLYSVKASYKIEGEVWVIVEMQYYSANVYKADLGTFLDGTTVHYYINATDTLGNLQQSEQRSFIVTTTTTEEETSTTTATKTTSPPEQSPGFTLLTVFFVIGIILWKKKSKKPQ